MDQFSGGLILFLAGQLMVNVAVLFHIGGRVARVETHIVHLMRKQGMSPRMHDRAEDYYSEKDDD